MRERYRFLMRSGLDLSCSLLMQMTLLGGMIAIFMLDSLRNLAYFTFALSICGPISLFAGMSLMELLFSGDERYQNLRQVGVAQLLCYVIIAALGAAVIALWDRSYLLVFAIVAVGRGADLICSLTIHVMRARGWFKQIALLGFLQFGLFLILAALTLLFAVATPVVEISTVLAVVSILQAALALYWLRDALARKPGAEPLRPFSFVRAHVFRSVAISLNSVQGNAPRYGLELLVSPQHQAAFSLVYTVVRAGTILFQSLFVPVVGLFKAHYEKTPRRAVLIASGSFGAASAMFTVVLLGAWMVFVNFGGVAHLGRELQALLTPAAGTAILVGCGVYLFRFGLWQLVSLLDSGQRQSAYALIGVAVTALGVVALTPTYGLIGAAAAEIIGNLMLLVLPLLFWLRRKPPLANATQNAHKP